VRRPHQQLVLNVDDGAVWLAGAVQGAAMMEADVAASGQLPRTVRTGHGEHRPDRPANQWRHEMWHT
jgi:hypothetical protein